LQYFYNLLFYLALPFIVMRLYWRSFSLPAYRQHLKQRLGFYPFQLSTSIWVHAVSVGEVVAAIPLIQALRNRYPHLSVLVTTMTPTGAAQLRTTLGNTIKQVYIPYDLPGPIKRFLATFNPLLGIIVETELWPNLLTTCKQRSIPLCLVNARLSAKSARGYHWISPLTKKMLQSLSVIGAQNESDAARFVQLGAAKKQVIVTGNIKFDLTVPTDFTLKSNALRQVLGLHRFIWIAASTHEGEEKIILTAHQQLRMIDPEALLILVPRHPDRFNKVAKLSKQLFATKRRSEATVWSQETAVYLGDTMGELLLLYGAADVAFVGGSLIPHGGHNIVEPGALGKAVLTGPHLFNFAQISQLFISQQALIQIKTAVDLAHQLANLLHDTALRLQMGQRAQTIVEANRGALSRQLELISQWVLEAYSSSR
jgi:3-deoxy-D-manno-octulosonic-acid transferase